MRLSANSQHDEQEGSIVMNDLKSHVLIHLIPDENTIGIRTYQRGLGRRGRFLVCRDSIREWLNSPHDRPFYDMDCGHVLCVQTIDDTLHFRIYWLSQSHGKLFGHEQTFSIPMQLMCDALETGRPIRHLYMPKALAPRIVQHSLSKVITKITSTRNTRRALCKAMRDSFHWRDDSVHLYPDGGADFYFESKGSWPIEGGLILHSTTVNTSNGSFPKIYYSIHT